MKIKAMCTAYPQKLRFQRNDKNDNDKNKIVRTKKFQIVN